VWIGRPAVSSLGERGLETEGRLVIRDSVLTEPLELGADVLMLVFDRIAWAVDHCMQQAIVRGLALGPPADVVREHREIVRDDRAVLFVGPVTGHGCSRRSQDGRGRGSCQQLRRDSERWARFSEPLVERMYRGAMLRRDGEM
jgi:hypothetical protein